MIFPDFFKPDNYHIWMILIGSSIAIFGAFVLNHKNSSANRALNKKVELSIEKSENAINHITGGDSWCYFNVQISHTEKRSHIIFNLTHDGFYPIPEVHIKMYELIPDKKIKNSNQLNLVHESRFTWLGMDGFEPTNILELKLNDEKSIVKYHINIGAPNGTINQEIILKKDSSNHWFQANRVERITLYKTEKDETNRRQKSGQPIELYKYISPNFKEPETLGWK